MGHAVAASLVGESGALHGCRANAGFDVPLEDSVCLDGVSGILQVGAGASPSRCVGQRDSHQIADVDGEFHETDRVHEVLERTFVSSLVTETERLHAVSESLVASAFAAETDQLHAESESIGAGVSGCHSAWRSRVGGLRLRRQAHSRLGNFVVDSLILCRHLTVLSMSTHEVLVARMVSMTCMMHARTRVGVHMLHA